MERQIRERRKHKGESDSYEDRREKEWGSKGVERDKDRRERGKGGEDIDRRTEKELEERDIEEEGEVEEG